MATPTASELEILAILWRLGESKIQAVNDELCKLRPVGYTTTLKTMQIMEQKGLLGRKKDGKSHIYFPLEQQHETQITLVDRLLQTAFGGSKSSMVMRLFEDKKATKEELAEIKAFLKKMEADK
ncbi:BlaI/MecI/CopY family transcriptional regulator [Undibacterium baiyunense]|uniref:BlaI/MecI/CopY family transcriptional regulator n=1 Tax=Undibacterium baiyunense TaxID=2828731 RepID=A0A941DFR2_9BURK|nr:BlaI/MecI/CopY family transcriptional regulator [Undibacterium baiyunense]MBR7746102.1 BlaI/MecI/CopY family transcriptional regulator [Undibacterium baiyunense]